MGSISAVFVFVAVDGGITQQIVCGITSENIVYGRRLESVVKYSFKIIHSYRMDGQACLAFAKSDTSFKQHDVDIHEHKAGVSNAIRTT